MGQRSKYRKFTEAYRELAVRRLLETDNVSELCREMRISRQLLYQWRDRLQREKEKQDPAKARVEQLRQENAQLKRALAERTLGSGFFQGCLAKSRGSTPAEHRHWRDGIYAPGPGMMPHARQPGSGADVPAGAGEPGGILSLARRRGAGGGRDGSARGDPRGGAGAPAAATATGGCAANWAAAA